jgi:hypothetical protein
VTFRGACWSSEAGDCYSVLPRTILLGTSVKKAKRRADTVGRLCENIREEGPATNGTFSISIRGFYLQRQPLRRRQRRSQRLRSLRLSLRRQRLSHLRLLLRRRASSSIYSPPFRVTTPFLGAGQLPALSLHMASVHQVMNALYSYVNRIYVPHSTKCRGAQRLPLEERMVISRSG